MKIILIALFGLTITACGQNSATQSWSSDHRELSFTHKSPWKLLPTLDSPKKTLAGVIDNTDGTSYLLQIGDDVSKDVLSESEYHEGARILCYLPIQKID